MEKKEQGAEAFSLDAVAERVSSLLARVFRVAEIIGYLGENRFAAFLTGKLTGSVVWEKAATLSEALWLAAEDLPAEALCSYVGVYVFRAYDDSYTSILRKAEYALEMARKDPNRRFFIYTMAGTDPVYFRAGDSSLSSQMLRNYIDEGVRVLEVSGSEINAVYVSPGYYRRLGLEADAAAQIRQHPADRDAYAQDVREIAQKGGQKESHCRISRDGQTWVPCQTRLLRISESEAGAFVLEISHNIEGLRQLRNQYDEKKEWLRFLAEETDCQLWEVDVRARTFRLVYTKNLLDGRQTVYTNFPESLIETGRVHQDCADRFRAFAEDMFSGKAQDSGNFILQYRQTSCYGWASMTYYMICDEDGRPEKAIGIKEDLSYLPAHQARFMHRRIMPADMYLHLYCYLQANLTADAVEKLHLEGRERIRLARYQTFTQIIQQGIARLFSAEDAGRFQKRFNRENLLSQFAQGRRWFFDRCQIADLEGSIQWISVGVNLSADPETGDVCLFAYLCERNQQQKWEEGESTAAIDTATGLYQPDIARSMVGRILRDGGQALCALAEIWIGGAEELFEGEDKRQDIMTALNVFLDTDCIAWREKDDSIHVFFPNAASRTMLKRRIENAFSFARVSLDGMPEMKFLRFVAGVACMNAGEADCERMQSVASHLCAMHSNEAADAVLLSEEEYRWSDVDLSRVQPESLASLQLEPPHMMTGEDKDVVLECLGLMLGSDSPDRSINAVLEKLGAHYHADRVYILTLTEQGRTLSMLNEWVERDKHSIRQSITGKRTSHFPVIARYAQTPRPVVLSMREREGRDADGEEISWQYAIFPMQRDEDAQQLLCIENPRRNIEHTALLDRIIPYLGRERGRLLSRQAAISPMERLYELPGMQDYMDAVYLMDSDRYRSLGVLAVDIPEFIQLKEEKGYEYGTRFLLRICEVLMEVFGRLPLFHTRETEFIALCADVTYEAFLNQCARVKQLVGRKYAGMFRLGCTWSDGIFKGSDLVNKARSIMKCANRTSEMPAMGLPESGDGDEHPAESAPWTGEAARNRFTIYLQPKVDMRTGMIVGAEALVRVLDQKGTLMPHGRVIDAMEKDGSISKLDYFVFDKVLDTLSRWKKKGYPLRSVSSNFSRKTLLNPTALASLLAISSRYPEVPIELVELEITETAGNFENNTFSEVIDRFGGYGMQFSLDDFGSSYSTISMLADLHFHSVKLDRSMVRNVSANQVLRMMVHDIANICENSGMMCIAEGVETQAQADALIENGCFYAQGFYYGRPMPVEEFERRYFEA